MYLCVQQFAYFKTTKAINAPTFSLHNRIIARRLSLTDTRVYVRTVVVKPSVYNAFTRPLYFYLHTETTTLNILQLSLAFSNAR